MSIEVTCPNGHTLKVKDKYAGQTGLCPRCQARILVPEPATAGLSEDAIVDLLGPPARDDLQSTRGDLQSMPVHQDPRHLVSSGDPSMSGSSILSASPTRDCPKCRKQVAAIYRICPSCWTYFSDTGGSSIIKKVRMACPSCGTEVIPGDHRCANCGIDLRPA